MKLLTKHYFSADKTEAAVADIGDIYPPLRGGYVIMSAGGTRGPSGVTGRNTTPTPSDGREVVR